MNRNARPAGRRKTSPLEKKQHGKDLEQEIVCWVESGTDPDLTAAPILLVWTGERVQVGVHDFARCDESVCQELRKSFSGEALGRFLKDADDLAKKEGATLLKDIQADMKKRGGPPPPMAFVLVLSDHGNPLAGVKDRWMFLTRRDEEKKAGTWEKHTV